MPLIPDQEARDLDCPIFSPEWDSRYQRYCSLTFTVDLRPTPWKSLETQAVACSRPIACRWRRNSQSALSFDAALSFCITSSATIAWIRICFTLGSLSLPSSSSRDTKAIALISRISEELK